MTMSDYQAGARASAEDNIMIIHVLLMKNESMDIIDIQMEQHLKHDRRRSQQKNHELKAQMSVNKGIIAQMLIQLVLNV